MNLCETSECHDGLLNCVRHSSKISVLKVVQVTIKHDPFDAMHDLMHRSLHPTCNLPTVLWSVKHRGIANLDQLHLVHQLRCMKCSGDGPSILYEK